MTDLENQYGNTNAAIIESEIELNKLKKAYELADEESRKIKMKPEVYDKLKANIAAGLEYDADMVNAFTESEIEFGKKLADTFAKIPEGTSNVEKLKTELAKLRLQILELADVEPWRVLRDSTVDLLGGMTKDLALKTKDWRGVLVDFYTWWGDYFMKQTNKMIADSEMFKFMFEPITQGIAFLSSDMKKAFGSIANEITSTTGLFVEGITALMTASNDVIGLAAVAPSIRDVVGGVKVAPTAKPVGGVDTGLGGALTAGATAGAGGGFWGALISAAISVALYSLARNSAYKKDETDKVEAEKEQAQRLEITNLQLEVVNRNLVALRKDVQGWVMPESYYFSSRGTPSFQHGGIVPGGNTQKVLAVLHGGEYVIPEKYAKSMSQPRNTINSLIINVGDNGKARDVVTAIEEAFTLSGQRAYVGA